MKYLITFIILLTLINCKKQDETRDVYIPDNELIIKTLSYKNDDKLPSPEENCFIKIDLLAPDSYEVDETVFYDTIKSSELKLTPDDILRFGHYGIKAQKENKTGISEIIYKGGSIQINLIIK